MYFTKFNLIAVSNVFDTQAQSLYYRIQYEKKLQKFTNAGQKCQTIAVPEVKKKVATAILFHRFVNLGIFLEKLKL